MSEGFGRTASGSVYDFLYHDARRVGSFLAQLNPDGHLQAYKRSGRRDMGSAKKDSVSPQLGVKTVLGIGGTMENASSDLHSQGSEETYDPLWTNALALLDHLEQRDLIARDVCPAGIGQFVLATGTIRILNLKLVEGLLAASTTRDLFNLQNEQLDALERANRAMGLDVIKAMPHTIQAHIFQDAPVGVSWMVLDPESMVVSSSDLILKYGIWLTGRWSVLGIKDANPDGGAVINHELQQEVNEDIAAAAEKRHSTIIALLAELMGPMARISMGRNGAYYGMTPLMIFREVGASVPASAPAAED